MALQPKVKRQLDRILGEISSIGDQDIAQGQKVSKQRPPCPVRIISIYDHGDYFVVIYQDSDCRIKMYTHKKGI